MFIIRKSESISNYYVLSVKVPIYINQQNTQISHYLIEKNDKKYYQFRGSSKQFPNLTTLITHCSLVRDQLPIIINLKYYQNKHLINNKNNNDFALYSTASSITSSVSNFSFETCSSSDW